MLWIYWQPESIASIETILPRQTDKHTFFSRHCAATFFLHCPSNLDCHEPFHICMVDACCASAASCTSCFCTSRSFVVLQIMIVAAKNAKHDTSLPTEEAVNQWYRQQIDAQRAQLRAQAGHLESQIRTSGRSSKCRKCYSCEELIMHQHADAITRHLGLDTSMIMSGAACATGPTSCAAASGATANCTAGGTAGLR